MSYNSFTEEAIAKYREQYLENSGKLSYVELLGGEAVETVLYRDLPNTEVKGYPFASDYVDEKGKTYSAEEFDAMDETARKKLKLRFHFLPKYHELSDGTPRQSQLEPLTTRIMIGNKNNRFVIGGIEKLDVVRGQGGIPILKDIPLIGWAFSTESESTKKSQLVVVAECESVRPDSAVPENINSDIQVIRDAVKGAGNHNSYGYGQWGFDSGKKLDLNTF